MSPFPVGVSPIRGRRGVPLAISLDIVNAFGTLSWRVIREALEYNEVAPYLRAIIEDYMWDRTVKWINRNGMENRREVSYVPQLVPEAPLVCRDRPPRDLVYRPVLRMSHTLFHLSKECMMRKAISALKKQFYWKTVFENIFSTESHIICACRRLYTNAKND